MILYRRPFMSLLTAVHKLVDAASVDADAPKTIALPRCVANELLGRPTLATLESTAFLALGFGPSIDKIFAHVVIRLAASHCS